MFDAQCRRDDLAVATNITNKWNWSRDVRERWGRRQAACVQTIPSKKNIKDIHCSSCVNLGTLNRQSVWLDLRQAQKDEFCLEGPVFPARQ